ncbi:glycerol-3-phosphate acyltransferase [Chloroflexota bacterium]
MAIWFVLLTSGAYLLGSVPVSYLAARLFRGIDLRQCGTGQVGAGNLWRMTSWKLGLPAGIFDLSKGLAMVLVAKSAGLDVSQQLMVGLAVIIGHNWPVFPRFSGGRGVGTTMGVILVLPLINDVTPWTSAAFFAILIIGSLVLHSSPLPTLAGAAALPVVSWVFSTSLLVVLGYLAIFLAIVIKRLTAPRSAYAASVSQRQLLLNRLFFDRDIKDRKVWMYRKPAG